MSNLVRVLGSAFAVLTALSSAAAYGNIFGENNLDDQVEAGVPNQCYSALGYHDVPVGQVVVNKGSSSGSGTGSLLLSPFLVMTNRHVVDAGIELRDRSGFAPIVEPESVHFSLFEGTPSDCELATYEVDEIIVPKSAWSLELVDYAILVLKDPVHSYRPIELPSAVDTATIIRSREKVWVAGFPGHDSVVGNWSQTVCDPVEAMEIHEFYVPGRTAPDRIQPALVHDCDIWPGSSGSPLFAVRDEASEVRYLFLGVVSFARNGTSDYQHIETYWGLSRHWNGATSLDSQMRKFIMDTYDAFVLEQGLVDH